MDAGHCAGHGAREKDQLDHKFTLKELQVEHKHGAAHKHKYGTKSKMFMFNILTKNYFQ